VEGAEGRAEEVFLFPDLTIAPHLLNDFLFKSAMAIFCGGLIGIERELKKKPAGFRTNILICLGSTYFMMVSILVGSWGSEVGKTGDPGRIAAQVVTGIGFLGAGSILHSRGHITGLTSAAMIWVVSAIGMAVGAGFIAVAVFSTVLILLVQVVLGVVERRLFGRCRLRDCEVAFDDDHGHTRKEIERILKSHGQSLEVFGLRRAADHQVLTVPYCSVHPQHRKFLGDLWKTEGVREVRLHP
jgi:putative Mg2+ transporter-C (MgtC) family protein